MIPMKENMMPSFHREQITVTLLAMMLNKLGYKAKSLLGFQAKILTDQAYKKARILSIQCKSDQE